MRMTIRWLAGLVFSVVMGTALAQPVPDAMKLYEQRCAVCHGDDASGSDRGPALSRSRSLRTRSLDEIHDIIQNGTAGGMPPFALPEDQLQALAGFVRSMNASLRHGRQRRHGGRRAVLFRQGPVRLLPHRDGPRQVGGARPD